MKIPISSLPPRYQLQAVNALAKSAPKPKKKLRQRSGDGMNGWEREFLADLRANNQDASIHREPSLPLANGTVYKVDFLVAKHTAMRSEFGRVAAASVRAYEVKGHRRAAGIVKLKVAASLYPWITFYLVTRDGGAWNVEEVMP